MAWTMQTSNYAHTFSFSYVVVVVVVSSQLFVVETKKTIGLKNSLAAIYVHIGRLIVCPVSGLSSWSWSWFVSLFVLCPASLSSHLPYPSGFWAAPAFVPFSIKVQWRHVDRAMTDRQTDRQTDWLTDRQSVIEDKQVKGRGKGIDKDKTREDTEDMTQTRQEDILH